LQHWLACSKSDDPWHGIPGGSALSEQRDNWSTGIGITFGFSVEAPLNTSHRNTSPRLQDWLAADNSMDSYTVGKDKKDLNGRRSALYAEVDEILTAFQMNRPMISSVSHDGAESECTE
jgi:hypothetical protein